MKFDVDFVEISTKKLIELKYYVAFCPNLYDTLFIMLVT